VSVDLGEQRVIEQKTIAIRNGSDPHALADALATTLTELDAEKYESRIFQFGPQGLLVVAQREVDLDPGALMEAYANMRRDGGPGIADDLDPATRDMLDKIFDRVGDVPLEAALLAMPGAVKEITRNFKTRQLDDAMQDLLKHRLLLMLVEDPEERLSEYEQVVEAVMDEMHRQIGQRLS